MVGCKGSASPAVLLTHFCLDPQWWMKGALCLLPISDTSSPIVISHLCVSALSLCFVFIIYFKKHDLQVDSQQLQTLPTPETNSRFLCMLGVRGDINASYPSCFKPLNESRASVSVRVKLCSCTFRDGWQTRVSPRTWLLHQPDLNFANMSLCGVARNPLIRNTPAGAHVRPRLLFPVVTETPRTDGGMNLASAAL